jgi:hypothetical protein
MHKAVRAARRKLINKTKSCAHIVIFAQNNCADAIAILAPKMLQINYYLPTHASAFNFLCAVLCAFAHFSISPRFITLLALAAPGKCCVVCNPPNKKEASKRIHASGSLI